MVRECIWEETGKNCINILQFNEQQITISDHVSSALK